MLTKLVRSPIRTGLIFLIGALIGAGLGFGIMSAISKDVIRSSQAADVVQTVAVLRQFHEGSTTNALSLLEHRLDRSIANLGVMDNRKMESGPVSRAILSAKKYRESYPFTNENDDLREVVTNVLGSARDD